MTPDGFPPIEDLALLSDGESSALVSSAGAVEWLCAPRMDSPSVFSAVLDRHAGAFRAGPAGSSVPVARRYVPGTLVVETTWMTSTGWLVVRDALVMAPWEDAHAGDVPPYRRTPRADRAAHVLLRTLHCTHGTVDVELVCDPVFGYGLRRGTWSADPEREPARALRITDPSGDGISLLLASDLPLAVEGAGAVRARVTLRAEEERFAALSWGGADPPHDGREASARLAHTERHWRDWLEEGTFPDHPWRRHLQRSAIVLKGLTYAPTGAIVAAASSSLPETPGGERNWDYRYTWIRDAAFTLAGLSRLGFDAEAEDFLAFIAEVAGAEEDPLHIMYGIDRTRELPERVLEHLSGYDGARPVRVGNAAFAQSQHDVWGMLLEAVAIDARARGALPGRLWPIVERQVEAALAHWREPDHGIWEVRGAPRHFTSSKVLCWVAADRGAELAALHGTEENGRRWRAAADEIHADVCARAVDRRGVFTQHYDTKALDAECLLVPLMGLLPGDDSRVRATVEAVAEELTEDGVALRYRVEGTDDGLGGEEGSFTICSFWLVSALAATGEHGRARALCERLLAFASPLDLYAEELEPRSGRHLGNTPQAFSHLALIDAVVAVLAAG